MLNSHLTHALLLCMLKYLLKAFSATNNSYLDTRFRANLFPFGRETIDHKPTFSKRKKAITDKVKSLDILLLFPSIFHIEARKSLDIKFTAQFLKLHFFSS